MSYYTPSAYGNPAKDHNYVAYVCREALLARGVTPTVQHDALIYNFAKGWNGSADSGEIAKYFRLRCEDWILTGHTL